MWHRADSFFSLCDLLERSTSPLCDLTRTKDVRDGGMKGWGNRAAGMTRPRLSSRASVLHERSGRSQHLQICKGQ